WIGSGGDELVLKVNTEGNLFPFYSIPGLQNDANLSCLLADKSGSLWMGLTESSTSLLRFDRKTRTVISFPFNPAPGKFQAKSVLVLMQDNEGFLWVGTENGLFKINPKTFHFQHFKHNKTDPESLSNDVVYALLQDSRHRIWVGTFGGGLNLLDVKKGKFRHFRHDPANPLTIGGDIVTSLHEDRQERLWVGGGFGYPNPAIPLFFDRFNPDGTFTHFAQAGTLGDVSGIIEDSRSNFWFMCGWLNSNIQRFEPATGFFTKYQFPNIVSSSNYATSLLAAKDGKIWMLTDNALVALDPDSILFQSYATDFGIRVIGHGVKHGMTKSSTGEVFFIGQGGFYTFSPDNIQRIGQKKPDFVCVTGIKVRNEPVFPGKNPILEKPVWQTDIIRLAHDQSDLSFQLATFNYRNPGGTRIEFMLENYDDTWRNDLLDGEATYLKLPPGKYFFKTSSINNQRVRIEGASIRIIISPPWWKSGWAYSLYATLFFGGIFFLYRFQLYRRLEHAEKLRLQELNSVKTKLYTNITHEFRTPLTVILGMARQVLDNPKDYFRHGLEMIIRNGQNLLDLVNQMLDLSKLESGKLSLHLQQGDVVNFLKYLVGSFHSLAESKEIK
ncbi:MAG TPA: two-component regulator propeller domain-containing protein, partial [Saprospiraceae bacterium]|nr:two-component regulator propeller domain-containing protein [Saprospiraceae bacterium]